jgi:hypothetical protein
MAERRYSVTIEGNVRPYTGALDQASARTNQFAGDAERAGQRASTGFSRSAVSASLMSGSIRRVAETATGFFAGDIFIRGARRIAEGIQSIVISGSDLTETIQKAQVTFGEAFGIVNTGAEEMARRFGVDKQVFIDSASAIGLIGKAAGQSKGQAADMGVSLTKLAADASSFYNIPLADALEKIEAGLVGEVRPLRELGVLLSEDATQREAVRLGIVRSGEALNDQQKVMARASLIHKGLTDASGDLERTQGSLANRLRAIQGHIADWAASMGQRAQPAILRLLDGAYRLGHEGLEFLEGVLDRLQPFFGGIARAAEAVGPVFGSIMEVVGPLASALGSVAGAPVIASLDALGTALGSVAQFLSHNDVVVKALASTYLATLVPAIGAFIADAGRAAASIAVGTYREFVGVLGTVQAAWNATAASTAAASGQLTLFGAETAGTVTQLQLFETTTAAASTEVTGLSAAGRVATVTMAGLKAVLPLAIPAAFIYGLSQGINTLSKLHQTGKDTIEELKKGLDLGTQSGLEEYIARLGDAAAANQRVSESSDEMQDPLVKGARWIMGQTTAAERATSAARNLTQAQGEQSLVLNRMQARIAENVQATGLNEAAVLKLAKAYGVDLTSAVPGASKVLIDAANAARASGQAVGDTLLELSDAQKELVSGIVDAAKPGDIVGEIVKQRNEAAQAADQAAKGSAKTTKAAQAEDHSQAQLAQAYYAVDQALRRVADAQRNLDEVRSAEHVQREVQDAEMKLQDAYLSVQRSIYAVLDATRSLEDARRKEAEQRDVTEAEFGLARAHDAHAEALGNVTQAQEKLAAAQDHGTPQELAQSQRELAEAQRRVTETTFDTEDAQVALTRAQQDQSGGRAVAEAQLEVSSANRDATQSARDQADAQKALNDLMAPGGTYANELADAQDQLRDALNGVQSAQEQVAQAVRGTGNAMTTEGTAGAEAFRKEITGVDVTLDEFIAKLDEHNRAAADWATNLAIIARRGGTDVAKAMEDMGIEAASQVSQMANATDADFNRAKDAALFHTLIETTGVQTILAAGLGDADAIAKLQSGNIVQSIAANFDGGVATVSRIMGEYFPQIAGPLNDILQGIGKAPIPIGALKANYPAGTYGPFLGAIGGVYGGGEQHVAQVAAPGTWRIWAEDPKSGAEAYVPQHGSRARGLSILGTAAAWYDAKVVPFAAGGINLPAPPSFVAYGTALGYEAGHQTAYERDLVQAFLTAHTTLTGGPGAAGPVPPGQLSDWLSAGIALGGKPPDWLSGMYRLTMAESGGDPHSYNPISVGGEHAEGLLQMLPSTFRAHMVAGHGDIWNPIDNTASSAGYIGGRYGSVYNTPLFTKPGAYQGYHAGGVFVPAELINRYDSGGVLEPGQFGFNGTAFPERVLSPGQSTPLDTGGTHIHVHIDRNAFTWHFSGLAVANLGELEAMMQHTAKEAIDMAALALERELVVR